MGKFRPEDLPTGSESRESHLEFLRINWPVAAAFAWTHYHKSIMSCTYAFGLHSPSKPRQALGPHCFHFEVLRQGLGVLALWVSDTSQKVLLRFSILANDQIAAALLAGPVDFLACWYFSHRSPPSKDRPGRRVQSASPHLGQHARRLRRGYYYLAPAQVALQFLLVTH